MLATSKFDIRTAPPIARNSDRTSDRVRTPAWVNRLLGVRPAPVVAMDEVTQKRYPTVEGVSSAGAFRSYPR
jgi:hypothetical protein